MSLLNPSGTGVLVKRVLSDDPVDAKLAALELCRRFESSSLPDLVKRFFEGQLSTAVFDLVADSWDEVQRVRNLDGLDAQFA